MSARILGKRDAIERSMIEHLKACGRQVLQLAPVEDGQPDLLVLWPSWFALIEAKSGKVGRVEDSQVKWHREYRGPAGTLHVARTIDEALAACGLRR